MKALIEVEMGETTCGECPLRHFGKIYDAYECSLFGEPLENEVLRLPACLAKYGTGDQPAAIIGGTEINRLHQWRGGDPKCKHTPVHDYAGGTFCVICQASKIDGTGDQPNLLKRIDSALRRHESIVKAQEALSAKPDPRDAVVEAARKVLKTSGAAQFHEAMGNLTEAFKRWEESR